MASETRSLGTQKHTAPRAHGGHAHTLHPRHSTALSLEPPALSLTPHIHEQARLRGEAKAALPTGPSVGLPGVGSGLPGGCPTVPDVHAF